MALTARIKKRYGDFLLDVAFTAGDGERLALLGASGSGKSVTLKCLAGIHRPDEGRIEVDGRVLFDSAWTCPPSGGTWATSSSSTPSFPT